ncbi:MAG: IS3 family transposase [Oscillospiraceae bacterium]|nr:IS3 family transposase [Oscillospiraceae bacterium]
MESLYHTIKRELVRDAHYDNPEQARQNMLNSNYNTKRIHSVIGGIGPGNSNQKVLKILTLCVVSTDCYG